MSNDNGAQQGINPKLVNLAVVLVIVCAISFLALWAIPKFTQKAGETTTKIDNANRYSFDSAQKFLRDYYRGQNLQVEQVTADEYFKTFPARADDVRSTYEGKNYKAFYFAWIHGVNDAGYEQTLVKPVWVSNDSQDWAIIEY